MGFFKKNSEPKYLWDLLELSVNDLKNINYKLVNEDIQPDSGVPIKDYLGKLPKPVLKVFDYIVLRIFHDEFIISNKPVIHAFFKVIDNELTTNKIAFVTNQLYSFFGKDDSKNKGWSDEDRKWIYEDYVWSGRIFTLDKNGALARKNSIYTISLSYDPDDGLEMTVFFISELF